jgi:hypothetical protein
MLGTLYSDLWHAGEDWFVLSTIAIKAVVTGRTIYSNKQIHADKKGVQSMVN